MPDGSNTNTEPVDTGMEPGHNSGEVPGDGTLYLYKQKLRQLFRPDATRRKM